MVRGPTDHESADDTETGDRDCSSGSARQHVADGVGRRARVPRRGEVPVGDECFAERARAEAGRADIVVTNHALLAIDAMDGRAVLPEHDVVVVDEAHELVDRVTGVATGELSAGVVAAVARRLGRLIDQSVADRLAEAGEGLGLVLEDLRPGRWEVLPQPASGALSAVLDAAAACRTGLGGERREEPESRRPQDRAGRAGGGARHHRPPAQAFDEPDPAKRYDVVWLAEVGADRHKVLRRRPAVGRRAAARAAVRAFHGGAHVGHAGPRRQLRRAGPAVGAPPGRVAHRRPGADPEAPKWSGLDVGSPFAHAKSGILYVAKSLPPPGRDGLPPAYLDEIAGLVEAAGGRTLGLFSSMRAAKQATEALRDRMATPLLCQGDDATMLLVKRFAEDDETSLFGTLSLWQGVDVPGPSLSCVIIDRIPFPRPDDPLVSARQRAADSRGGNGFLQVSATHAALLLAQGAGRLLRGMDDRGVVAILDPAWPPPATRLPPRLPPPSGRRTTGRRSTRPCAACAAPESRFAAASRLGQLRLQRRREADAEADVAEQRGELRGPGVQGGGGLGADVDGEVQGDLAVGALVRAAHDAAVDPGGGAAVAVAVEQQRDVLGRQAEAALLQPMVDGSRPAAAPPRGALPGRDRRPRAARSRAPRRARPPRRRRRPARRFVTATVQPAHQARSARVPGPNVASHRRASSAAASRGSRAAKPSGDHADVPPPVLPLIHVPVGRARTTRSSNRA